MRKNKKNIQSLRKEWKVPQDFEKLSWGEQLRFSWWIIRGNPRGIFFLFQQVKMGKSSRDAYDSAKGEKNAITLALAKAGYYLFDKC